MIIGQIHTPFPDHILSGISMPEHSHGIFNRLTTLFSQQQTEISQSFIFFFQNRKIMVKLIEFFSQVISVIRPNIMPDYRLSLLLSPRQAI